MANTTTDQEALDYIKKFYIPKITDDELATLGVHYPQDPVVGCKWLLKIRRDLRFNIFSL